MDEVNQQSSGSKSKMPWIIGGIVILLAIAWLFQGGWGMFMQSRTGIDRNVDGSTTYSNEEGSVTVGGNAMPENWPSDAPQNYAGASIQYSGTSNPQTGKAGSAIVYTVNASLQSVVDHYKSQLSSAGWTVEGTATVGPSTVISARKDDRVMGIYISDAGNGQVAVTAGIEM